MANTWDAFGVASVLMPNERNSEQYKLGLRQLAKWHEHCATKGRMAKIRFSYHLDKKEPRT